VFTSSRSPERERPSPSGPAATKTTRPLARTAALAAGAMLLALAAPASAATSGTTPAGAPTAAATATTPRATATTTPAPPAPPAPAAATAPFDPFAPPAPALPAPPAPLRPAAPLPPAAPSASKPAQPTCAVKLRTPVRGRTAGGWGDGRGHTGVDILAPVGTKVRAAACGTVTFAGRESGYGTMICIRHSTRFRTCYAHLSSMAVDKGTSVAAGKLIGRVGMTGRTSGPHLHFETRVDGHARNPLPYLRGSRTIPGRLLAPLATPPLPMPATGGAPAALS
jgi:murein DD-endopeptidase MepM/ murein hydrolase activator NlpD